MDELVAIKVLFHGDSDADSKPPLRIRFVPAPATFPSTNAMSSMNTSAGLFVRNNESLEPPTPELALKLKNFHPNPSDQLLTRLLSCAASINCRAGPNPSGAAGQGGSSSYVTWSTTANSPLSAVGLSSVSVSPPSSN